LALWDVKRKPWPVANAPPIDVFPAYDEQPAPRADDYIADPHYPAETYFKKFLSGKTVLLYLKSTIFSRFQPIAGLTLQSSFCIWLFSGKSQLGLGVASAAALYFVTYPRPAHNHVNLDFLLDPLSKSEFLSFLIEKCVNEKRIFYFNSSCCF
jgi:hypothetical protein